MNYWIYFSNYAVTAILFWLLCMLFQILKSTQNKAFWILLSASFGAFTMMMFTYHLWQHLGRPPMRTLGETRLWYAVFLPVIGIITYARWKYKWLLNYSLVMACVFLCINYFNPDTYNKALMPALQSIWFIPHVLVYIFSYALLAVSSIVACFGLYKYYKGSYKDEILQLANNLVYVGFGFLSLGLLFGALWAKEAWGHYWTWDPKETWAMLTWLAYLIYIHLRYRYPNKVKPVLITLALSFIVLLLCWFGVNYMPSAAQSVHTYTNT
ncbi:cytochrome c biogenesis protein [Flavobacterium gelatinilyticum]|uniref:cytochrome c biogenesis protein n=1 Tax=Flavobacterium gelatinilyticum TaxID=3003260 RepID=UPI0024808BB1|nr:cytochrome c biogenesis protein CcsA [Flavobacterium gelatinilyticum]